MSWTIETTTDGKMSASFEGHLDGKDGSASARKFVEVLGSDVRDVVLNVRKMSSYDKEARQAWQEGLWPQRKQIRSIHVIGANTLIRMGAILIGVFLGARTSFSDDGDL